MALGGFLDIGKAVSAAKSLFGTQGNAAGVPYTELFEVPLPGEGGNADVNSYYTVDAKDWYRTYPFQFTVMYDKTPYVYALPIPPSAFDLSPVIASEATPTLGGVVEETSETVFWMINLNGTFGQAISKSSAMLPVSKENEFRQVFNEGSLLGSALGNLLNVAGQTAGAVQAALSGDIGGALSAVNNEALPYNRSFVTAGEQPSNGSLESLKNVFSGIGGASSVAGLPVTTAGNGFTEAHALHNFFLAYLKIKQADPDKVSLHFESMKDGFSTQCIVKNFRIGKNASKPFLYEYNISLKAWNLGQGNEERTAVDRFGPGGDLSDVNSISGAGIEAGVKSLFKNSKAFVKTGVFR